MELEERESVGVDLEVFLDLLVPEELDVVVLDHLL